MIELKPIDLPNGNKAQRIKCSKNDYVAWVNNTGGNVTGLILPACVLQAPSPINIPAGEVSLSYKIVAGFGTSHDYTYTDNGAIVSVRNGTIDVS